MTEHLSKIVADNRAGTPCAIVSVCTAHPDALRASLNWAERRDIPIVIEATSNQANQDGGYTGMTAADFASALWKMADGLGIGRARVTLGGDHLGPQAWRALPPEAAMEKALVLVESYVEAGFDKIHLDCSQGCAGEPEQLSDHDTATRSADLAARCEAAASGRDILYVIGTEVPPPGGARADEEGDIPATTPDAARQTLAAHAEAFAAAGLEGIEARVAALLHAVSEHNLPEPLLSQVFSNACLDRAETLSGPSSQRLIDAKIELALDPYDLTQRGAS